MNDASDTGSIGIDALVVVGGRPRRSLSFRGRPRVGCGAGLAKKEVSIVLPCTAASPFCHGTTLGAIVTREQSRSKAKDLLDSTTCKTYEITPGVTQT